MHPISFRGVFPVFQTPFDDQESFDLDQLQAEVEWIAQQGVHGIVFGMVSETLRLTDRERNDVIRIAADVARSEHLPCIASIGAESTRAALKRMDDALQSGAVAVMATPPLLGRHSDASLLQYYRRILSHSDTPVVVQDASGYVGQALSIDMQAQLFDEFGPRVMFKPEAVPLAPTLDALRRATHERAHVFEGMGGAALIESYLGGVSGTMPGAEVCWAVVELWQALERGDLAGAWRIHNPLAAMIALQSDLDSFVVCEKYLLTEQQVIRSQTARTPLAFHLDSDAQRALSEGLSTLREAVDEVRQAVESAQNSPRESSTPSR